MKNLLTTNLVKIVGSFTLLNNLSRQKCAISAVLAMIKSRSVQLQELALYLNDEVLPESNERRLQEFFRTAELEEDRFALFFSLFLSIGKVDISIDRTEWDFGKLKINLLTVVGSCGGMGVPLFFDYLDNNSGNSNTEDRIKIVDKLLRLIGIDRIRSFAADREFIGENWIIYLVNKKIPFFIRIPKHHYFVVGGVRNKAESLLGDRKRILLDNVQMQSIPNLRLAITHVWDKKGNMELLSVVSNVKTTGVLSEYKKRWTIEAMFQDFKGQGFNVEETHLSTPDRIIKLIYLVSTAYLLCLSAGLYVEKYIKPPTFKKHKYRAKSIFRKGMDLLRNCFLGKQKYLKIWHALIDRFFHITHIKLLIINSV